MPRVALAHLAGDDIDRLLAVGYAALGRAPPHRLNAARRVRGAPAQEASLGGARALELVEGAYRAGHQRRAIDSPLMDGGALAGTRRMATAT